MTIRRLLWLLLFALPLVSVGQLAQVDVGRRIQDLDARLSRLETAVESRRPALSRSRVQRWVQEVADLFTRRAMRDSLELLRLRHDQQVIELEAGYERERTALEREIRAMIVLGADVPEALPASLAERSMRLARVPTNLGDLRMYRDHQKELHRAQALLEAPPDAQSQRKARDLERMTIDATRFPGLNADRERLIFILDTYCERTGQLAAAIRTAKERSRDEAGRRNYLARYSVDHYPYLQRQKERAHEDPKYRLVEIGCR